MQTCLNGMNYVSRLKNCFYWVIIQSVFIAIWCSGFICWRNTKNPLACQQMCTLHSLSATWEGSRGPLAGTGVPFIYIWVLLQVPVAQSSPWLINWRVLCFRHWSCTRKRCHSGVRWRLSPGGFGLSAGQEGRAMGSPLFRQNILLCTWGTETQTGRWDCPG